MLRGRTRSRQPQRTVVVSTDRMLAHQAVELQRVWSETAQLQNDTPFLVAGAWACCTSLIDALLSKGCSLFAWGNEAETVGIPAME